jgi:hypothetical protein
MMTARLAPVADRVGGLAAPRAPRGYFRQVETGGQA